MMIDNWLYMAEIVHACERRLPIDEEIYCDFYLPSGRVYIEYWEAENEEDLSVKTEKLEVYKKYGFKLIGLEESDVEKLDEVLPRLLLKHGVNTP